MIKIIDNLKINYEIYGKGDYIFVMHGWGCNVDLYKSFIDIFSPKYTLVLFDFPGFGKSDFPEKGWDTCDYTNFTIKFIESFNVKKVNLIGHSFGTRIMILMATSYKLSFSIERMVFIAGAGIISADAKYSLDLYNDFLDKKNKVSKNKSKIKNLYNYYESYYPDTKEFIYLNDVMLKCWKNAITTDLESNLTKINTPTLLLCGEKDDCVPLNDARKMDMLIPDSGLVVFNNSGHFCFLDEPYLFEKIMKSYFEIK